MPKTHGQAKVEMKQSQVCNGQNCCAACVYRVLTLAYAPSQECGQQVVVSSRSSSPDLHSQMTLNLIWLSAVSQQ